MSLQFDYKVFTTHNLVVIVKIKQIKHVYIPVFTQCLHFVNDVTPKLLL